MLRSQREVTTNNASLNLKKLCRHFSHKVETHFDERRGEIHFPFGAMAGLEAVEDRLLLVVQAEDAAGLMKIEQLIADHLVRFASNEALHVSWQRQS